MKSDEKNAGHKNKEGVHQISSDFSSDFIRYNIYDLQQLPIEQLQEVIEGFVQMSSKPVELLDRITKPLLDRVATIHEL